ncbi:hypothetical protein [Dokdonella sp.]|uniref:hypothetical protein n=1 Tax=Dokdonella sp. TaxID=2291710 RepID=UPI003783B0BA
MGEFTVEHNAIDSAGKSQPVIEWRGDHGTAQVHDDADLKDPKFYSRYTLSDGTTKLELQADGRKLRDPNGNFLELEK